MLSRLGLVLLFLTVVALALAYTTGLGFSIPLEKAVQADLKAASSPALVNKKIVDALERDDVDEADMYFEIARFMNYEMPPETMTKLADAHALSATVVRNTWQFGEGFATGQADTNAGLAGAVASDLTVVGDVRDIASEGTKLLRGEPYSELILGLSVVGIGVTAATIATGGGGVIVKAGVSLMKAAKRTGRLTAEFAQTLTRLTSESVNMPLLRQTLRSTDLTDLKRTQEVFTAYGRNVKASRLVPVLGRLGELNNAVGPAETVRLMRFVKTTEHLDDVSGMTKRFGIKSRGIMELTGKTALRSFKTSFKYIEWVAEGIWGLVMWLGGLIAMVLMRGIRIFKRRPLRA
ncbi:MAG: hypothetical protein JNK07_18115 [Alphaproteobacteria bacterium]|nr:hypothetical protein [Alphaproteobacteria bacterium]